MAGRACRPLLVGMLAALSALVAGPMVLGACGDDDRTETTGGRPGDAPGTGDATPGAGSSADRPPDLVGEVTHVRDGAVLVEEQPGRPDAGRKAWVALEGAVVRRGGEEVAPDELAPGQAVSVWTGICAESYPEQCDAEAITLDSR